jgi:hypothetical protein
VGCVGFAEAGFAKATEAKPRVRRAQVMRFRNCRFTANCPLETLSFKYDTCRKGRVLK